MDFFRIFLQMAKEKVPMMLLELPMMLLVQMMKLI